MLQNLATSSAMPIIPDVSVRPSQAETCMWDATVVSANFAKYRGKARQKSIPASQPDLRMQCVRHDVLLSNRESVGATRLQVHDTKQDY